VQDKKPDPVIDGEAGEAEYRRLPEIAFVAAAEEEIEAAERQHSLFGERADQQRRKQ
jgi:hypothetical protein